MDKESKYTHQLSTFHCHIESITNSNHAVAEKTPTIQQLQKYVIERIAHDWEKFAIALELDSDGHKIAIIQRDNWGHGVQVCCLRATQMWLRGEGKLPVTWATLTECLEDIHYPVLADDVRKKLQDGIILDLIVYTIHNVLPKATA